MSLSRADRLGFLVLSCIALITLVFILLWNREDKYSSQISEQERQTISAFTHRIHQKESLGHNRNKNISKENIRTIATFHFDPNTASYETFLRLGLEPKQAHDALKYRAKGGYWNTPDDFAHLYGLSQATFLRLRPYISITPRRKEMITNALRIDTTQRHHTIKLHEGQTLPINSADTTALQLIPGVGRYTAMKIVRYRERLGGFVNIAQLDEISNLPPNIHHWIHFDDTPVHHISINKATFKTLLRHPYLNYEQVKAITKHIRQFGALHSWSDLQYTSLFPATDTLRLQPYFKF